MPRRIHIPSTDTIGFLATQAMKLFRKDAVDRLFANDHANAAEYVYFNALREHTYRLPGWPEAQQYIDRITLKMRELKGKPLPNTSVSLGWPSRRNHEEETETVAGQP